MLFYFRHTALAWLVVAAFAASGHAFAQSAGKITLSYDNSGFIFSFQTGKGKLTLNDGSKYAVTVDGYSLGGLGFSAEDATGDVLNLIKPSDLSGEYSWIGGGVFDSGSATLKNTSNNVVIRLQAKRSGVRLGFGVGYATFKLGRMIKGPRMPPKPMVVKKAPPPPRIAATPPPAPQPRQHNLEFGFNKSRVSLEMSKSLEAILEKWKGQPITVRVTGYTDTTGANKYNLGLSRRRAEAVKRKLVEMGVPGSKISALGVGETDLLVKTKDNVRIRKNRRVLIVIEPSR